MSSRAISVSRSENIYEWNRLQDGRSHLDKQPQSRVLLGHLSRGDAGQSEFCVPNVLSVFHIVRNMLSY